MQLGSTRIPICEVKTKIGKLYSFELKKSKELFLKQYKIDPTLSVYLTFVKQKKLSTNLRVTWHKQNKKVDGSDLFLAYVSEMVLEETFEETMKCMFDKINQSNNEIILSDEEIDEWINLTTSRMDGRKRI